MKFIRNSRFRDRIIDIATKTALLAISVLACLWMISGARAGTAEITGIQQGAAGSGEYAIDFAFSSPVAKDDVAVEFQRNFIQVSLKNVSAYPARTEKLSHPLLEKVFTYQYQPDLARARVLLKVDASTVENTATWEVTAKGLRILVKGSGEVIAKAAKTGKDSVKSKAASTTKAKEEETVSIAGAAAGSDEDAQIVKEIVSGTKSLSGKDSKAEAKIDSKLTPLANTEEQPIFTGQNGSISEKEAKSKASPVARVLASLLLVVGVIGAGAIAYRRFVLGRGMPFQRQNRMIETITTQSIGPKRSVAIIRVLDQYMVVGMAGDNMNLLANLGTTVNLDKYDDIGTGASAGGGSSFADAFQGALGGISAAPTATNRIAETAAEAPRADFRSMIKKRLEGLKPI